MNNSKIKASFYLAILALIWGSSFILMKKGLLTFAAPEVASLRIFFAGLIFVPYFIKNFKIIPWNKLGYILLFAFLEIGAPPFLYTYAQSHIDSSSAGILNSMVPLFTLFTGMMLFRLKYHWLTMVGVFIGLLGAFAITFMNNGSGASINLANWWGLLVVIATLFYGLAGNMLNVSLRDVSGTMITAVSFVAMAIPATIYLGFSGVLNHDFSQIQVIQSIGSIAFLSAFGSALAILIFSKLIRMSNALYASFVTYLIPFVSLIWGWIDGENISFVHFFSLFVILGGIYVANIGEKKQTELNYYEV
jgi:drug/metabolite transporter (DMT)-like permease